MEPRQYEQAPHLEQRTVQPDVYGQIASESEPTRERGGEKVPEVGQVQAEISQITMPALPAPVISVPSPASVTRTDDSGAPLVASDDDLIEKEWVDKAKSIIAATKDNPYKREQEINKLQIEYIRKRYGRTVGDAGE
jgi:hypothetical protein